MDLLDQRTLERLFGWLAAWPRLALAVSGGADSTALMVLVQRWAQGREQAPVLQVLSVDHGLTPDSDEVARRVCSQAARHALPCTVLRWPGPKPRTGIEQAARQARYELLGNWCRRHQAALVVAHTLQDQAETMLMRLARGSGLDGLAAMARCARVPGMEVDIPLLRPLLEVDRSVLRDLLRRLGIGWHEDAANADASFERVRWRRLLPLLAAHGLTATALARSADRLQRARTACEEIAQGFIARHVRFEALAWAVLPLPLWRAQPAEIRLRVLARLLGGLRGRRTPLHDLAGLERLLAWLEGENGRARVLAGMRLQLRRHALIIGREPGRIRERITLRPKARTQALWDARFLVEIHHLRHPVGIVAAHTLHPAWPADAPPRPPRVPAFVWWAQPAIVSGDQLLALPASEWQSESAPFTASSALALPNNESNAARNNAR